jgi:hypothetical protein
MNMPAMQSALHFLTTQQAPADHRFAGAFQCTLHGIQKSSQQANGQVDWNVFNTASTLLLLQELEVQSAFHDAAFSAISIKALCSNAKRFLRSASLQTPRDSYGFWPFPADDLCAEPDLDDTALALLALQDRSIIDTDLNQAVLTKNEKVADLAWRLFAPYRFSSGMPLATASRWAAAFPGIFLTWMKTDGPVVIDAVVIAHVCRLLLKADLFDFPGLSPSLKMLATILNESLSAKRTIPIEQLSPYYRSRTRFLYACAQLPPVTAEAMQVREAVKNYFIEQETGNAPESINDLLWIVSAQHSCGLPRSLSILNSIAAAQQADGGWPEISLCTDLLGHWRWTSRSLSTALVMTIFSEAKSPDFIPPYNTRKELAASC